MDVVDALAQNQAAWALERLQAGADVPPTLLGLRSGAVVLSIVMPNSTLPEGVVDEAARAAGSLALERGVDEVILALDTADPRFGVSRRSLVLLTREGSRATPVLSASEALVLGTEESLRDGTEVLEEILERPADRARERCEEAGNLVLDLENRFGS